MLDILHQNVIRGAAFLDTYYPHWAEDIDPERLEMDSSRWCVVGQLHDHSYSMGIDQMFDDDPEREDFTAADEESYGFFITEAFLQSYGKSGTAFERELYQHLTTLWKTEIDVRYPAWRREDDEAEDGEEYS